MRRSAVRDAPALRRSATAPARPSCSASTRARSAPPSQQHILHAAAAPQRLPGRARASPRAAQPRQRTEAAADGALPWLRQRFRSAARAGLRGRPLGAAALRRRQAASHGGATRAHASGGRTRYSGAGTGFVSRAKAIPHSQLTKSGTDARRPRGRRGAPHSAFAPSHVRDGGGWRARAGQRRCVPRRCAACHGVRHDARARGRIVRRQQRERRRAGLRHDARQRASGGGAVGAQG